MSQPLKFGIGQPVPRGADPMLLRGRGRYGDDLALPGQAWAVMVRSPHAHGVVRGIDAAAANAMPGVLGVITGHDLAAYGGLRCRLPFKNRDGSPLRTMERPALPTDRVRFVGDPVACVVAETRQAARDAAEAVRLDIDALPAVTEAEAAAAPGAPLLYDGITGNEVLDFHYGDAQRVAEAFAGAAHVTRLSLRNSRVVVCPMEPRSAAGEYDPAAGRWTLHVGCQGVFGLRAQLAEDILRVPLPQVRVLTGNVGGSFGMKAGAYPEYVCLLHAAKLLGRPVRWTDDRSGSFVSDQHGRDHQVHAALALDAQGRFLAVRLEGFANMGAYLATVAPQMATNNYVGNITSTYDVKLIEVATRCILTNTSPVGAYRGAGRPEANYYMERLIEAASRETGIDSLELRRRNYIGPGRFPYAAASGRTYDTGEFAAVLQDALRASDWEGYKARQAASRARGLLRGRGVGNFLECTAPPANEMGGIRFEPDGTVTIITGTLDYGQGHWTPFAQVLHEALGVPFERIRLLQGDSDELVVGGGTGGSKSLMASGTAIMGAAAQVIEAGRQAAAHALEAAPADIEFAQGRFSIAGTDRGIGIVELAECLRESPALPDGVPSTLDARYVLPSAPMAYPNGCHVAEVEIDAETGAVRLDRYVAVSDFGTLVNPMLVEGQVHGGIAQGAGQALMEHVAYSEDGQLLSGSFMDYALPRAADLPSLAFVSHPVPATTNPLGAKGCGEAGVAGALPAVMNAVLDALAPLGVTHIDMPATPERVWQAIRAARAAA